MFDLWVVGDLARGYYEGHGFNGNWDRWKLEKSTNFFGFVEGTRSRCDDWQERKQYNRGNCFSLMYLSIRKDQDVVDEYSETNEV